MSEHPEDPWHMIVEHNDAASHATDKTADTEYLVQLLDELEISTQSIFSSYTWRLGRGLSWPLRKLGLLSSASAAEHIESLFRDYHAWRECRSVQSSMTSPSRADVLTTLRRLLNRNSGRLLLLALRDIRKTGVRGFVQRAWNFIEVNRHVADITAAETLGQVLANFRPPPKNYPLRNSELPVDIILPVYNGLNYLRALMPRLVEHTHHPYRLIIVDDASPDAEVTAYLDAFSARYPHVLLLRAEQNQGFVKTVNWAFEHVRNHFVILNQDTELPADWLPRLIKPLLDDPTVASATPYTNAGTICSFPNFPEDSGLFADLDVDRLDRCFRYVDSSITGYVDLPTGIGFCMALSKQVANRIGLFDAETYGRGYGEENDWCMRATELGYHHVMVPDLFVYHKHGGSFQPEEKLRLGRNNLLKLSERYPDYNAMVQQFIQRDPLRHVREFMILLVAMREAASSNRLVLNHDLGGGASSYLERRLAGWLEQGEAVLLLRYSFNQKTYLLTFRFSDWQLAYTLRDPLNELLALARFVRLDAIDANNLVSYPDVPYMLDLLRVLRENADGGTRLSYYVHDFQSVCPTYTLLNHEQRYCGVPEDLTECEYCLAHNYNEFRIFYPEQLPEIRLWRQAWGRFFGEIDRVVCFSHASADILRKAYPTAFRTTELVVEPHKVPSLPRPANPPSHTGALRIGVLGAINVQKGINIIKEMAERIEREQLDVSIVVIGYTSEPLSSPVVMTTGKYQRDQLPELVEKYGIHGFLLPSITPETYHFAADEVMMLGMPLAVFDLGAPAERVRKYSKGLIIKNCDANSALDAILEEYAPV